MMSENGEKKEGASTLIAKKPYHAPKLRHLGSVRTLTLGSAGGDRLDAACLNKSSGPPDC